MAITTTTIGAYPKPDFVQVPDWFHNPDTPDPTAGWAEAVAAMGEQAEEVAGNDPQHTQHPGFFTGSVQVGGNHQCRVFQENDDREHGQQHDGEKRTGRAEDVEKDVLIGNNDIAGHPHTDLQQQGGRGHQQEHDQGL